MSSDFEPMQVEVDELIWLADDRESFTMKSYYTKLDSSTTEHSNVMITTEPKLCKMKVPSNIQVFG